MPPGGREKKHMADEYDPIAWARTIWANVPADRVVGQRCTTTDCPLARVLRVMHGTHGIFVSPDDYVLNGVRHTFAPALIDFVTRIDARGERADPVTAGEALRVLDEVTQ